MFDFILASTYTTDAIDLIDTTVGTLATVLFSGLTTVLGVIAVLIGLFFVIKLIRKWVSRGK